MELWDVYDKDRRCTGRTMVRGDSFPEGCYHLVVHACIFHPDGRLLIQRRQPTKESWPDKWDITMGGSAIQGEDSPTAAMRELQEELGLTVDLTGELPALTLYRQHNFNDIYVLEREVALDTLKLQREEVQAVSWATKGEVLEKIADGSFIPYTPSYIGLLFDLHERPRYVTRGK